MSRARQTAAGIRRRRYVEWRALREIEVGVCDGMTYAQVSPGPRRIHYTSHRSRGVRRLEGHVALR